MEQNRFKSPIFWSGVATQIIAILLWTNVIDLSQSEVIKGVVIAVCELWVAFSQQNNPSSTSW
jgi:hypothetical protein